MDLFPHQKEAVSWLAQHKRGLLHHDPGLGKTATVLRAFAEHVGGRLLVVAPSVVLYNWQREARMWTGLPCQIISSGKDRFDPAARIVVMSHAMLLKPAIVEQITGFSAIALDEAHLLRNPSAARSRVFYLGPEAVCRRAPYRWAMTGTPLANSPVDMWTMLAGLAAGRLRNLSTNKLLSYQQFRDRFCITRPSGVGGGVTILGTRNEDELRKRLDGFAHRAEKGILGLPPVLHTVSVVEIDDVRDLPPLGLDTDEMLPEELVEALRAHPSFAAWRRACGLAKVPSAVALIENELEAGERKIVLAAHHLDVIAELERRLALHAPVVITGAVSAADRTARVAEFQENPHVRLAILQIQAGGVGITLHAARQVILVEQSFVPADNQQVADRVHRIGQKESVLVRHVALANSVDEVVADVLARKSAMIAATLQGDTP